MTIKKQLVSTSFLLLVMGSCTSMCEKSHEDMSPEQVVESYLEIALNMSDPSQKDLLLQYTTGALKAAINQATDEVIKAAYIDRKLKIISYSVVERRFRTPREMEITFQLTYKDVLAAAGDENIAPSVTTENSVSCVKEGGVWLVRDVLGNKTSIDFPVSKESEISAKATN